MSSFENRIQELNRRVSEIDEALGILDSEYNSIAANFSSADRETLRQAERLEQKVSWLKRERDLAVKATEQVQQQAKDETAAAEAGQRRATQTKAREICDALATLNVEIDDMLLLLRQALERRANCLRELAMTETATPIVVKLQQKQVVDRAAAFAGLHRFLTLSTPAPGSFVQLRNANQILVGVGREAAPVLINGGGTAEPARKRLHTYGAGPDEVEP
jgi:hypothetical protein